MQDVRDDPALEIRPANEASWEELHAVFGDRGEPGRCKCQWFRTSGREFWNLPREERAVRLQEQTGCGHPDAPHTSGLLAFLDGEPVGWVAVEPRSTYRRLRSTRVPWAERVEDPDDDTVWAISCFVVRTGFRKRGISYALTVAAAEHARVHGARAVEGYPMITHPGTEITWGELYVGSVRAFEAAGFREVTHPTPRRKVMRLDFD